MLRCIYFGLLVLLVLALVPQGAKLLRSRKAQRFYQYILFSVYLSSVLWLTLANRFELDVSRVRFEPFYVIRLLVGCAFKNNQFPAYVCKNALKNSKHLFDSIHATPIEDLLLNVILFMPLGFFLPYLWPKLNMWKTTLIGFFFSICIETTQYFAHWGCLGLDDVLNNTLGTCVGFLCWTVYRKAAGVKK